MLGSKNEPARLMFGRSVTGVGGREEPLAPPGVMVELEERRIGRMRPASTTLTSPTVRPLCAAREALTSDDLSRSDAISLTRMAGSVFAVSMMISARPTASINPPSSSAASTMLRMMRRMLRRTSAFLVRSLLDAREKSSGFARDDAIGGERRRSFWSGSRKFSNESALEFVNAEMIACEKSGFESRCSSTFAVSS